MIRVTWEQLEARVKERPAGYREAVLALAEGQDADGFWLSGWARARIAARYPAPVVPKPTLVDLVFRFGRASKAWASAGFPVVSRGVLKERLRLCRACPHWVKKSLVPKCERCGCYGLKLWLATEQCPLPDPEKRWKPSFKEPASGA